MRVRMIAASPPPLQTPTREIAADWRLAMREAISTPAELLHFLELDPALPALEFARLSRFPLKVPRGFARRMRKGDPNDPLFLQVWPSAQEAQTAPGFSFDAVGDMNAMQGDGVLHKYRGRALLITTGACAVHCRYCFRQHFPYSDSLAARDQWQPALRRLAADSSIHEVILSGGDPLSLSNERLKSLFMGLRRIPHIRRVRIHTRQPIVLPERIDHDLLDLLRDIPQNKVMVVHANHAQELDHTVSNSIESLRGAGLTLLNQSVLLKGINDETDVLFSLHERLFSIGILPYYLHLMDRVEGAAHFEVTEERAVRLMAELAARSPGYLVPRLAREVSGMPAKQWIQW